MNLAIFDVNNQPLLIHLDALWTTRCSQNTVIELKFDLVFNKFCQYIPLIRFVIHVTVIKFYIGYAQVSDSS